MKVIDLHCDTIGEMYDSRIGFCDPSLDINENELSGYEEYVPVTAVWSRVDLTGEECFSRFVSVCEYADKNLPAGFKRVLAVEGGSLLCGDISRLGLLAKTGVRFLTLMWSGVNELGGAHGTHEGLTPFGEAVVRRCFELGIIPDVSHSSDESFHRVTELAFEAGKPVVATHSDARAVCEHPRNLTDEMYLCVCKTGGIVGRNPEPTPLGGSGGMEEAVAHALHYYALDPDGLCLGCDFDGRTYRPSETAGASCLVRLYGELVKHGLSGADADKIFFGNAKRFFTENDIIY